jgi:hypothetical protein
MHVGGGGFKEKSYWFIAIYLPAIDANFL